MMVSQVECAIAFRLEPNLANNSRKRVGLEIGFEFVAAHIAEASNKAANLKITLIGQRSH